MPSRFIKLDIVKILYDAAEPLYEILRESKILTERTASNQNAKRRSRVL
jgi:hypothetical protein